MCGICGVSYSDQQIPEQRLVEGMTGRSSTAGRIATASTSNRVWVWASGGSPSSTSRAATSPSPTKMNPCGSSSTARSHNFRICLQTSRRGHEFRTRSDTECILHLYEEYGNECESLCGQAAFARGIAGTESCSWRATAWARSRSITRFKMGRSILPLN